MGREERSKKSVHSLNGTHNVCTSDAHPVEVSMADSPDDFYAIQDAIEARDRAMRQAEISAQEAKLVALKAHDEYEVVVARIRRKYPTLSSRVNYTPDEQRLTWVPARHQTQSGSERQP